MQKVDKNKKERERNEDFWCVLSFPSVVNGIRVDIKEKYTVDKEC